VFALRSPSYAEIDIGVHILLTFRFFLQSLELIGKSIEIEAVGFDSEALFSTVTDYLVYLEVRLGYVVITFRVFMDGIGLTPFILRNY
jgi:hypothetical protein